MSIAAALGDTLEEQPHNNQPQKSGRFTPYWLMLPGMLWLAIFFVVPLVTLFGTSLMTPVPGGDVGEFEQTFHFANYVNTLTDSTYYVPLFRSFIYAGIATILALAIGYPLAYAIAFKGGRYRNILLVLVIAPFFVSFILRTVAWRQILADEGPVVAVLRSLGLVSATGGLYPSALAVITGLVYNFLPFMTLPIYASLERVDHRLIEASGDLYAKPLTGFRKVTWPLSMPGVVAGTLLTFIPAAGDYVNAALLGRPSNTMIGNRIEYTFLSVNDYPTAAVLSFILMACILVIVLLYVRRTGSEDLV
ncbi:MAG: ABC transporter permease [Actinobacteria bacterium]|nr:ABC transporter permease [Actinomycetota bacterium]MCB0920876.1 ABC transporter permease [Actinomycetota bacterium]